MLSFDSDRHEFTVGRVVYYLEPLDFDAAAHMAAIDGKPFQEQVDSLAQLLKSKARCDKPNWRLKLFGKRLPAEAVGALSMTQQARLFQSWMRENAAAMGGVMPGESNGSAS